jgi:hypothetical protein
MTSMSIREPRPPKDLAAYGQASGAMLDAAATADYDFSVSPHVVAGHQQSAVQ